MAIQLLLLEDVDQLGRKGEVVSVKPGYSRNYLLPQKKALIAGSRTVQLQARLKEERLQQAIKDKGEAEILAKHIEVLELTTTVKVDQNNHLYGSVTAQDVAVILASNGVNINKRNVVLPQPIKRLGEHKISLRLNEGVLASFKLTVLPDRVVEVGEIKEAAAPQVGEEATPPKKD